MNTALDCFCGCLWVRAVLVAWLLVPLASDNGLHGAEWWVQRTLDYGRNASRLGANGLIGIHWRTLAHAPEFASLAIFPWLNSTRAASIASSDIYMDIATNEFGLGPSDAATAAGLMGTCDHTWNESGPIIQCI